MNGRQSKLAKGKNKFAGKNPAGDFKVYRRKYGVQMMIVKTKNTFNIQVDASSGRLVGLKWNFNQLRCLFIILKVYK